MKKRIMAVVVTAAMVMGALAGCGSSSAKETQAPASTEAASETAAASETTGETEASDAASGDLTHVNVAYMANYASLWQVATAINKGYFKDEGLDVQLYMFQDGPTEIASMESGSIDVAYIGPGAHKLCIKGQADIFCFSQLGNADCVMGLKSHGVNSLEDLKGKKVAYASGTSSETILKRALNSVGLTMDDIEEAIVLASRVVIMSARPGRIKEIIDIDIPHPRDQATKMSPRFVELKNYIWSQVYQEYLEVQK